MANIQIPEDGCRNQLEQPLVPPTRFAFLKDNSSWQRLIAVVERSFRDGIPRWQEELQEAGRDELDSNSAQVDVYNDVFDFFATQTWGALWDISKALYEANATSYPRTLSAEWAFLDRDLNQPAHSLSDPSTDYLWNPLAEALTAIVDKHLADLFQPDDGHDAGPSGAEVLPSPEGGPSPTPSIITWDCPQDGLDPFDIDEPQTQHLFLARGWCRGWIASAEADNQAYDDAYRGGVPMGYKSLVAHEKLAVVNQGTLVAAWSETDTPSVPPHHDPAWRIYRLLLQRDATDAGSYASYREALDAALELSGRTGEAIMVSRLLRVHAWH
ncbi:hypothetical protein [Arthrobacter crystallopoietes]|uniref:Uncharacterized protein n=1 Tax=Crystallibacter crystallopoietes TaxID=37928 RepID=A0A1H1C0J1_9MICC|nr:hypothetical protein [Arthrobacter crystallopoietes]AUI50952.1 hypothetical protein AC20117_09120 [Arthrobacter crystallopoietes]SDQ57146.1 hypothetical protein SAMN04489742_1647 [Arthrobacter crystallopoietes]